MTTMRIAGAQIHNNVGDIAGNVQQVAEAMQWAEQQEADVLVVPELALTGYPPADLVLHEAFIDDADAALAQLAQQSGRTTSIVSTIERVPPQRLWDSRIRRVGIVAKLLCGGEVRGTYQKRLLPTYGIFDEGKYIAPGNHPGAVWRIGDTIVGISICEDIGADEGPPEAQSIAGAQILLVPNASPYYRGRAEDRLANVRAIAVRNGLPVVYLNFFGGQDDVVFDGGSLVVDADGQLIHRCAEFVEERFCVDVPVAPRRPVAESVISVHTRPLPKRPTPSEPAVAPHRDELAGVWQALVLGTRDFARKNGFPGIVLGLSGGIDSAITAAVATDALGPENVLAIGMPTNEIQDEAQRHAEAVARHLGIGYTAIPLPPIEQALTRALQPELNRSTTAETTRGLEAWSRAAVLSAFADERGVLILATGNKSELSIGVAAHGDLIGGFAPLRDCPKTLLYKLAEWRNARGQVIPEPVLTKPPTAQAAEDIELPSYDVLDPIVERYLEQEARLEDLIAEGFDPATVEWVLRRVDDAEFLRRQTPIGVRVTRTAFNQDRRMPISNAWRPHRRR